MAENSLPLQANTNICRAVTSRFTVLGMTLLCIVLSLALVACSGTQHKAEDEATRPLQLGFVPIIDSDKMVDNLKPLEEALSEELGRPVKSYIASNYVGVVQALNSGQIDMACIPPLAYVLAHQESGAKVGLVSLNKSGQSSYQSILLVAKDSGINEIKDLIGKKIAFVDPSSTSGYLFPASMMKQAGLDLDKDCEIVFSGGHDKSLQLLLQGEVDAIGSFSTIASRYAKDFPEAPEQTRTLATSEPIPSITLAFKSESSEETVKQISDAFKALADKPEGKQMFVDLFNIYGFVPSDDSAYDGVRETARLMDIDLEAIK